jgi:hypothetical protein
MPTPKTGRKYIRTKIKQAANLNRRILDYLHDADTYQDGKNAYMSAAMPILVQMAVALQGGLDTLYKNT